MTLDFPYEDPYLLKFQFLSHCPRCSQLIRLQNSSLTSQRRIEIWSLIFVCEWKINWDLYGMDKHAKLLQNNTWVIYPEDMIYGSLSFVEPCTQSVLWNDCSLTVLHFLLRSVYHFSTFLNSRAFSDFFMKWHCFI